MPPKKAKGKKKSKKASGKKGKKINKKISKKKTSKKKISKKKISKKNNGNGIAPAGWCQDFPASPGDLCQFTPPGNATITQSGPYWPFCGPNGTNLPSPITFLVNTQVYIKSNAPDGTWPFLPSPCNQGMIHSVTVTG
jgi:hypothetical protein